MLIRFPDLDVGTTTTIDSSVTVPLNALPPLQDCELVHYDLCVKEAKERIQMCMLAHPPERIGISFNGGKDSVVMFELLLEVLGELELAKCHIFMFGEEDEFPEMRRFREGYVRERAPHSTLITVPAEFGIKDGLGHLKTQYGLEAVFLGTRHDDPNAKYQLGAVEPTSNGWPMMMRYCPVFDFNYCDVWRYLAIFQHPVCVLYREGYTSLGRASLTDKNPALLRDGVFLPAWVLADGSKERDGRKNRSGL